MQTAEKPTEKPAAPLPLHDQRTPTLEEIARLRTVRDPRLSPDGLTVAYVLGTFGSALDLPPEHIRLVPAAPDAPRATPGVTEAAGATPILGQRLTSDEATETDPRWRPSSERPSPGARQIAFLSRPKGGPSVTEVRLASDVAIGTASTVHPSAGPDAAAVRSVARLAEGVGSLEWSPRGTVLSALARWAGTAAQSPPEAPKPDRDAPVIVGEEAPPARLWILDPEGTTPLRPVETHGLQVRRYAWSPGEKHVAVVGTRDPQDACGALYVLPVAPPDQPTHAPEPLCVLHDAPVSLAWSPDGRTIALCTREHTPDSSQLTLVPVDPDTGSSAGAPREVLHHFPAGIEWIGFHPNGRLLLGALRGLRVGIYALSPDSPDGQPEEIVSPDVFGTGSLGSGSFTRFGISLAADGKRFACTRSGPHEPGNVVVGSLERSDKGGMAPAPAAITEVNPEAASYALGDTRTVRWHATDGTPLEGLLLTPPNYQSGRAYPTVLEIHGGPRRSWWDTCQLTEGWASVLASRGYVVLLPNQRGSAGYGPAFVRANAADLGGADLQDVLSGLDMLVAQGIADPARTAVAGWSYGGYLTAWAVTQTDRFRAAVVGAAITDRLSWTGQSPPMAAEWGRAFWGDALAVYRDPAQLTARSPVMHVRNVKTPTLLLHGATDNKIPPGQADQFYWALRGLGVPVRYVRYPGAGHGLGSARHIAHSFQEILSWLDRYLRT